MDRFYLGVLQGCSQLGGAITPRLRINKIDYLEISSAGLERAVRRVEQLVTTVGRKIRLRTYKLCAGLPAKDVICVLDAFDGEKLAISGDFGSAELAVADVSDSPEPSGTGELLPVPTAEPPAMDCSTSESV